MLNTNHCPIRLKIFLLKIFVLFHTSYFESLPHFVTAQFLCGNCMKILYVLVNLTGICSTNLFRICKLIGGKHPLALFFSWLWWWLLLLCINHSRAVGAGEIQDSSFRCEVICQKPSTWWCAFKSTIILDSRYCISHLPVVLHFKYCFI